MDLCPFNQIMFCSAMNCNGSQFWSNHYIYSGSSCHWMPGIEGIPPPSFNNKNDKSGIFCLKIL